MNKANYGYTKNLGRVDFEQATQKLTEALKTEGFGVLTTIDMQEALKKKLGVDVPRYKILGACNPPLAYQALQNEPLIGLLLPCNAVVMEEATGEINVSIAKPLEMFKAVDNEALGNLVKEVDEKIKRVMERI